jgi:MFS transporter, FSR family, fosmidomycin resistance protein
MTVLIGLSTSHMLNDILQSLVPAVYPILKPEFGLNFTQIGLITFVFQCTASILQPLVGLYTDRRPLPYSLVAGMACSLVGLVLLAKAGSYPAVLIASALVGFGSAVFHPEASRLARIASGGKHGMAQSLFQVGGNFGTSLGPLLVAAIVVPYGQRSLLWFCLLAGLGIVILSKIGRWYQTHLELRRTRSGARPAEVRSLPRRTVVLAMSVLIVLVFSKYIYLVSFSSYYTFYLVERFGVTVQQAQLFLFLYLFAVAAGTIIGGPVGDRIGRKYVIWISILGVAPFAWLMPEANLFWTAVLTVIIGVVLASAFSAILVYAQELVPGRVGMIAGLFFGLAFGIAGIGSAVLGKIADHSSIVEVFRGVRYLPLLGICTVFLPNMEPKK